MRAGTRGVYPRGLTIKLISGKKIVLITHHAPSPQAISKRYISDGLNASYVSDLKGFIKK
jgi:hypothetical protein